MDLLLEDLPRDGLPLIPPSSPEYAPLLADIERRLEQPVDGAPPLPEHARPRIFEQDRPTSAILLNRSKKTIAALQTVRLFETFTGRSFRHSHQVLSAQALLLPFGLPAQALHRSGYWNTILPGSKRYLGKSGMVGDNTDVRLPTPDEKWPQGGGIIFGTGGGGMSGGEPVKQVTLVLDGVFFTDGEFVGQNREKLFEKTVAEAEAYMLVARIACEGHNQGLTPAQIRARIETATGPAPENPGASLGLRSASATFEEIRQGALQRLAFQFARQSKFPRFDDERHVHAIMDWAETVLPQFRKRG